MNIISYVLIALSMIVICEGVNATMNSECMNLKAPLSTLRKRRHLTFPDDCDMVLTISLVKAFMTHAPSGWNIALEIDVLYPLPDAGFTNAQFRKKIYHRQKRQLWDRLKSAMDFHNINGQSCILRSVCEAKAHLLAPGKSLVHDILRAVFTAPLQDELFLEEMKTNYNELSNPHFCDEPNDCTFSMIHFILSLNKQAQ